MQYSEALKIVALVKREIPCIEPVPSGQILRSEKENRPDDPAVIICSVKVRRSYEERKDFCTVYDGSPCPLNHNEDKLNSYRTE